MECSVEDCSRKATRKGKCRPCGSIKLCVLCDRPAIAKSLCSKHWQRVKNGTPMDYVRETGKTYISSDGYVVEYQVGHMQADKDGKLLQHRRVVSERLGRRLHSYENVHHKNGNRQDNRPENLELWVKRQPAGQRVEDLVEWAKWILKEYDQ